MNEGKSHYVFTLQDQVNFISSSIFDGPIPWSDDGSTFDV